MQETRDDKSTDALSHPGPVTSRSYEAPRLVLLGNVSLLVAGGFGTADDGITGEPTGDPEGG